MISRTLKSRKTDYFTLEGLQAYIKWARADGADAAPCGGSACFPEAGQWDPHCSWWLQQLTLRRSDPESIVAIECDGAGAFGRLPS